VDRLEPERQGAGATLRLYLTSYENPHPDKEVVSVDYVSAMAMAAPFLVAMTIEPLNTEEKRHATCPFGPNHGWAPITRMKGLASR